MVKRESQLIKDVQGYKDTRNVAINKVGIKNLRLPVTFENGGITNHTVMSAELTVTLQAERKGTHMSRFIETWDATEAPFTLAGVAPFLAALEERLDAESAQCHLQFPLFYERIAPVSQAKSVMDFECEIIAKSNPDYIELRLMAPVTSLCPCSKEISEFSAHSQRSHLSVSLRFKDFSALANFNIDEALKRMESVGSSQLYPLLKRPDEKFVTEAAYNTPRFVEDLVRELVLLFKERTDLESFSVASENFESIHNHEAYAEIEYQF